MQSPMIFGNANGNNNTSMNANQLAQMYLASPLVQSQAASFQTQQQSNSQPQNQEGEKRRWTVQNSGGLVTPGPSGEMFPQLRPEMMSPMQLEMFARSQGIEGDVSDSTSRQSRIGRIQLMVAQ
jgi:hypothetical protein